VVGKQTSLLSAPKEATKQPSTLHLRKQNVGQSHDLVVILSLVHVSVMKQKGFVFRIRIAKKSALSLHILTSSNA
jgi:hypothetical protein